MSETLQDYEQSQPARPVFLTVLCILTFIGSGWYLISGGIQYFTAETQAKVVVQSKEQASSDMREKGKDDAGARVAEKMLNSMSTLTVENIKQSGIATSISAVFCLLGAFMMWNLKKTGFYLYIIGSLIGIVSPFLIFGSGNLISIMSSVGSGFVGIVFIILYGVNLKHMR